MNAPEIHLTDPSLNQPEIRRGRVPPVAIYEITKSELDALEQGAPSALFLNLAIFFWSTAGSFLTALLTANIQSAKVFMVFTIIVVVSTTASIVLTILWWNAYKTTRGVVDTIRKRIPDDNVG
jgi:hypothetical protein